MNYVFDVDGTLTPSREKIDAEFHDYFLNFCKENPTYLVTGSDYPKTLEQLGEDICRAVLGVFSCSGNMLIMKGEEVYRNDFELSDDERIALKNELYASGFPIRTGNHIEERIGTANFSIVGRNANRAERQQYVMWDNNSNERLEICKRLNAAFPRLECVVGGETSIDIFLKGRDKAQIVNHIGRPFTFFGDRCEVGGNDHSIYKIADTAYYVEGWEHTYSILQILKWSYYDGR